MDSWEMMPSRERRYSVPAIAHVNGSSSTTAPTGATAAGASSSSYMMDRSNTAEDLHAWSIYRQNLNSDFADSALGSSMKAPLPYGNFQLDPTTINSIMNHPKCGPKSGLAHNTSAYLKFGLPRVVARSSGREESSGYDSSNDGSPVLRSKNLLLSRSDPDFRKNLIYNNPNGPSGDGDGGGGNRGGGRGGRMKSISEANLLSMDGFRQRPVSQQSSSKISKLGHGHGGAAIRPSSRQHQQHRSRHGHMSPQQGASAASGAFGSSSHLIAGSVTGGGFSVYPQRDETMLNEKYFPRDDDYFGRNGRAGSPGDDGDGDERHSSLGGQHYNNNHQLKHPHVQVRSLGYGKATTSGERQHLLDDITFEARAGEILGLLTTSEREGTAVLDILAKKKPAAMAHSGGGFKIHGDLIVNGVSIPASKGLYDRLAYVQQDIRWCPDMTVRQSLLFTALLQAPGRPARNFDTRGRIDALITDLGLEPVRHTRVCRLTVSERRRLNVASHLLLDTDIVLLDQPTRGMDIFDTFFLVEYLRQWAARGRIVILTIHPPTYEIFTMLSRVALISSGRMMYGGRRREMLPYFAFIEFPCPAYKNPSDYYLDLVTLDDLTGEALLESSQRAEHLSETFRRRQEMLSDPGPPGHLPPKNKRANVLLQMAALWIKAMVFTFPSTCRRWVKVFLTTALMSIIHGAIFWNVRAANPSEQEDINDRQAMHYVLGTVALWPSLMLMISDAWKERDAIARDISDRLYSPFVFFITKTTSSFIGAAGIFLTYLIPVYALAGFTSTETLFTQIGYVMAYLLAVRVMSLAVTSLCASRHQAAAVSGVLVTLAALGSGFAVQLQTMNPWSAWMRWVSPLRWTLRSLQQLDFGNLTHSFECSRNPLTRNEAPGLVLKIPCGLSTGNQALNFWAYSIDDRVFPSQLLVQFMWPLLAVLLFWALFAALHSTVLLCCKPFDRKLSRHKRVKL